MRAVVFINSHSRQAAQNIKYVKRFFSRHRDEFEILDYIIVDAQNDFKSSLKRLRAIRNYECVIVGSGDGTIISVLNALKNRKNITYGFIPLGTANLFVRSLGLPNDYKKTLKIISNQHARDVSLGSVNNTLFVNGADIGIPAQVANNLTNKIKKHLGLIAYAVSGVRELLRHEAFWCQIEFNGKKESFYTHTLFIANGNNRGPVNIKHASVYNDTLILGYSATKKRWEYALDAMGFIIGRAEKNRNVYVMDVKQVTVKTWPIQLVQADGEVIGKTPAEIKIVKNSIRVLTSPESSDQPDNQSKDHR